MSLCLAGGFRSPPGMQELAASLEENQEGCAHPRHPCRARQAGSVTLGREAVAAGRLSRAALTGTARRIHLLSRASAAPCAGGGCPTWAPMTPNKPSDKDRASLKKRNFSCSGYEYVENRFTAGKKPFPLRNSCIKLGLDCSSAQTPVKTELASLKTPLLPL